MAHPVKRTFGLRMLVDVLLAFDLVIVMATALIEEAPHEYLGIALAVLAIAHVVLNRRWFASLAKGRWNAVRVLQALTIFGLIVYLLARIQFAAADHSAPIFVRCGQYAAIAALVAGVFHYVRALLTA